MGMISNGPRGAPLVVPEMSRLEQTRLADSSEVNCGKWRGVALGQPEHSCFQPKSGIGECGFKEGRTAALAQRCPNVRADGLAISYAQPPLPSFGREATYRPRYLKRLPGGDRD